MPKQRKTEAAWIESQSRWQIKVQVNGRRKTFYSSVPGRKGKIEAERKADQWLSDGATDDPRFETFWNEFLAEIQRTTGTGNYENHESAGRLWILPGLKLKRLSNITLQDWQDVLTKMYEAGRSHKYIQNIRGSMTACYNYAHKRRLPLERPDSLIIPNGAPVGERSILQPDKLKTLFSVDWIERYGQHRHCFFIHAWRFLVLTGMRRGELCGLRKEDVEENVLYIRRSINSFQEETRGKTKNAQRYIVLSTRMLDVLSEQEAGLKKKGIISPWLFPDEKGDRLDGNHLSKIWQSYRRQHGMGCTIYELRHTLVSIAKADMPLELLKGVVGHSATMDTTGIYGHEVDGEAERASALINDVFDRILGK